MLQNVGEGHQIFADRYYTTFKLIQLLNTKKYMYFTGTLNLNRMRIPTRNKKLWIFSIGIVVM